ncbi:hypothetical protein BDY19DRAFT_891052 [Irpex rosettiformis]|uniref:Uncharacterized protein n=1 Tax=Irpex rosettiformis TaxID=378272 RepID=A0ACB8U2Y9_9APHY|nr:hypothetical protein BDY19DRAFT_891052 [Irpex rosettiformis]
METRGYGSTSLTRREAPVPPSTPISPRRTREAAGSASHKRRPSKTSRSSSSDSSPEPEVFVRSQPSIVSQDTELRNLIDKPKDNWSGTWSPTLILENSGSVARDHLASERTFLAYMRTSLAIASTGVALVQLFNISSSSDNSARKYSRPIGAVIVSIGLATLVLGLVRFFSVQKALVGGTYPVARVSMLLLAITMSVVVVAVFGIIIGVR